MARIFQFTFIIILLVGCTLSPSSLNAQQKTPVIDFKELAFFDVDALGYDYLVFHDGTLVKRNESGQNVGHFTENRYGWPSSLDVLNPQKALLYYPDFQKAILIDRLLNATRTYDLEGMGIWEQGPISLSSHGQLWVYFPSSGRVKEVNQNGEVLNETDPVNFYVNQWGAPERIIERQNVLYVSFPSNGWLRFDRYGSFIDKIQFPHSWFRVDENGLIFWHENTLHVLGDRSPFPQKIQEGLTSLEMVLEFVQGLD